MGLLTQLQDEAETVQRRAEQRVTYGNRKIGLQNEQAAGLTAQINPLQDIVDHYNTVQVQEYNAKVATYNSGWLDPYFWNGAPGGSGLTAFYDPSRRGGDMLGIGRPPAGNKIYAGPNPIPGVGGTLYRYNANPTPIAPDNSAATGAISKIEAFSGDIDALNASGKSIERRNGLLEQRTEREVERLNTDIEFNKRALSEEASMIGKPQATSVFDQNMAGVFTSIADWLHT